MIQLHTLRLRAPNLLNRKSWPKPTTAVRALSKTSDYCNQSRGGLPRFFSDNLPTSKGGVIRIQGDEFWHMVKVLRLSINDRVELFNGKGGLVEGSIQKIDRAGLDFVALADPRFVNPHDTQWHVYSAFGSLKGGRADWLVEKCTELGANSVTPILTKRSPSISDNRFDRLQRVVLAATKQCQRLHEMILHSPVEVQSILPLVAQSKLCFVAVAEATPIVSALNSSSEESIGSLIIGPEGDFTEKELKMLTEAGATAVGLGPNRLRVETATMTLLASVMLWSDSRPLHFSS